MKYLFRLLMFLIVPLSLLGQNTTVTGTVTDPDGFAWAGGSVQFTLHNDAGGTIRQNGVPLTSDQMNKTVPLDNTGSFSVALATNTTLTPTGTQWTLLVCPAASAPCQTYANFTAFGASMSLTTAITSQIQALRFPASYTARGYGDVEISPLPPPGGTYFNLQSALPRFWNGTIWTAYGSGGGGGGTPNAPANSIQYANPAVNGFASSANLIYDPATQTLQSKVNTIVNSYENVPKAIYDPMSTKYQGGLAAAIAGSSGFTVQQVLQYTEDYAYCDILLARVSTARFKIALPTGLTLPVGHLILYSNTDFGGESFRAEPFFQHTDATQPMIRGSIAPDLPHGIAGDSLTCPQDSSVHTPGLAGGLFVHNISISGMGNTSAGAQDIGIYLNGAADLAYQITGGSNTFGAQGIIMSATNGLNNFIIYAGYPGAQIAGCASFTTGAVPVSSNPFGSCAAVQDSGIDNEMYFVYATDAARNLSGNGPGSCYPSCAAIGVGQQATASFLFGQVSDIAVQVGISSKVTNIRADASSKEAVRVNGSNNFVSFIDGSNACLSNSLQAAYTAGTPTGCGEVIDLGQGNTIDHISVSPANGIFGPSYQECVVSSAANGGSGYGGVYGSIPFTGNPNNTTRNDMMYCGAFSGQVASGSATFTEATRELLANVPSGLVNLSGISNVRLNSTTPVTNMTGGINGQRVLISGIPGATIVPGNFNLESIQTCNGQPETFNGFNITEWKNEGGYQAPAFGPNNSWREICNTPQLTPLHVNYAGNPTPSDPSLIDAYANMNLRQQPNTVIDVTTNLHGPTAPSGQYCFVTKVSFPDGSYTISNLSCSVVDLAHQTAGGIFVGTSPQSTNTELYLVSNTTTSGIPIGKYPPHTGAPGQIFWDGPTVIAAGGDGTTTSPAGSNYTGMYKAPWGILLNTFTNTQPACDATTRGRMWLVDGAGSSPDVYQGCIQIGAVYQWINLAFGSTGTTGFIPLYTGPGSIGNSHIDEISNSGFETFTQGIVIQDTSGAGGFNIGTEGSVPSGCGATNVDCLWADSTNHQWIVNNNNVGPAAMATVPVGAPIAVGHCVQGGANDTLTDAGAACGAGGGLTPPGTPTFVMDLGGGTAPTATSLSAGSTDWSGYFNFTTGTCTAGICPTTTGVFTIIYSRTYTPQLKCEVKASNLAAMALANNAQLFIPFGQLTTAHFVAQSNSVGIPQSTAFSYYYHCDPQ